MIRPHPVEKRGPALFAGGALVGWFVQSQTLFTTAATSLQHVLLLAFVVQLEVSTREASARALSTRVAGHGPAPRRIESPAATRGRRVRRVRRVRRILRGLAAMRMHGAPGATLRRPAVRAAAALAAVALGGAGLAANHAIHSDAAALARAETSRRFMDDLDLSIRAFEPLAVTPRLILFENLTRNWRVLRTRHRAEARRLLAWANAQAPAAVTDEPEHWRIHQALARMYTAVAATDPGYAAAARLHYARSLELAPYFDPLAPPAPRRRSRR